MDTNPVLLPAIPANTIRAARSLYGQGNIYLRLGDRVNSLVSRLDPAVILKNPGEDRFVLLALMTIIQFVEKLTDVELAESIQRRMDLRYALHLATPSPRLDPHSLCEFRSRILGDRQTRKSFEEMLQLIYPEIALAAMNEKPDTDFVLHSICENEVSASMIEAMLRCMEALSANYFNWLRRIALPHWYERYNRSLMVLNFDGSVRKQEVTRDELRADTQHLLHEIYASNSSEIMEMPETKDLNLIWEQLTDSTSMKNCSNCINKIH